MDDFQVMLRDKCGETGARTFDSGNPRVGFVFCVFDFILITLGNRNQ